MWGISLSKGSIQNGTNRYGQVAHQMIEEEVSRLEREAPKSQEAPDQLAITVDGAFVRLIGGEWKEVKTATFGEINEKWSQKKGKVEIKSETLSYFSQLAPAETFNRQALYEWHQRGGENASEIISVNDGARWIQGFLDYHAPQAVRILDFPHALSYMATIGKAVHGEGTATFKKWFRQMAKHLKNKPPDRTLSALKLIQRNHLEHPQIGEIEQAIRYLEKRKEMIDYPHFQQRSLPIGSGSGESAHKIVMQRRMKQAGMQWKEEHVNPMLALRTMICNRRWQLMWPRIHQRQRELAFQEKAKYYKQGGEIQPEISFRTVKVDADLLKDSISSQPIQTKKATAKEDHPWRNGHWPVRYR